MNSGLNESLGEGPAIPEMVEAVLDDELIEELMADLQMQTRILGVNGKAKLQQYVEDRTRLTLESAVAQLRSGQLLAIQIRYHFEDAEWTDTIFRIGEVYRLVRCRHSSLS